MIGPTWAPHAADDLTLERHFEYKTRLFHVLDVVWLHVVFFDQLRVLDRAHYRSRVGSGLGSDLAKIISHGNKALCRYDLSVQELRK
jgi:hypothetical protein